MRIIILLLLLIIVILVTRPYWTHVAPPSLTRAVEAAVIPCPDSAEILALDRLFPQLGMGQIDDYLTVWLSHTYTDEYWQPRFQEQQAKLDKLKEWADKIEDSCARRSYLGWIQYYQRDLNSAKKELRTHAQEREMNDYEQKQKVERERTQRYSEAVDGAFPSPPQEKN